MWIVEDFGNDEQVQKLYNCIIKQDDNAIIKHYYELIESSFYNTIEEEKVFIYGSIQFTNYIKSLNLQFYPGVMFTNPQDYSMSNRLEKYKEYCLNSNCKKYVLKDFLKQYIPSEEYLFIRPDSSNKSFTGQVISQDNYQEFLNVVYRYSKFDQYDIYVGEAYNLTKEWRCIISHNQILTMTLYKQFGKSVRIDDDYNIELKKFIEKIISIYQPDTTFVIDICECNNQFYILELGEFSSCGLYTSHIESLVKSLTLLYKEE